MSHLRTSRRAHSVLVLLAALLAAAPAFAQSVGTQIQFRKTEIPRTRFRVGPLRLAPSLALTNAGRDTNIFLDPTDPLGDTSVVLRGTLEGHLPVGRRLRVSGRGWLDWSYYKLYQAERSTDPGGEGRAELDVGPFTLMGGGGGLRARQRYTPDIDQRIPRHESWSWGGLEWRLTRRLTLSGGIESRRFRYDDTGDLGNPVTAASLDRNTQAGHAEARYSLTSQTTFVATADRIVDDYLVATEGRQRTTSYRYLGGFEFGEKALVNGRFLAGARQFPASQSGSLPAYSGPAFLAELILPVRSRARLVGSLLRDVYSSATPVQTPDGVARNSYVLLTVRGTLEFALPFRFLGQAFVGYGETQYLLPTIIDDVAFDRNDRLNSAGGSLLWRFSENFRAGFTGTWYKRKSTVPGNDYDRWVYGVSAELTP